MLISKTTLQLKNNNEILVKCKIISSNRLLQMLISTLFLWMQSMGRNVVGEKAY